MGNGCRAPLLRRCPLIPALALGLHSAVPRDLHLRDEDSQAQRKPCQTQKPVLNSTSAGSGPIIFPHVLQILHPSGPHSQALAASGSPLLALIYWLYELRQVNLLL